MATRDVVQLTTGMQGSGKSWSRCGRFLYDDFLADEIGVHYSNFPLRLEDWSEPAVYEDVVYEDVVPEFSLVDGRPRRKLVKPEVKHTGLVNAAAKRYGRDPDDIRKRVKIIPREVLKQWEMGISGPWEYFAGFDLTGAHIALDEAHVYVGKSVERETLAKWSEWLAEVRHCGCTVEFLTVTKADLDPGMLAKVGTRVVVINHENERFFRILNYDIYQLKAKLLGVYRRHIEERELRKSDDGKEERHTLGIYLMDPFYFDFYDSFSKPQNFEAGKSERKKAEWERYGWGRLLWWFFLRNPSQVLGAIAIPLLFVWALHFGGVRQAWGWLQYGLGVAMPSPHAAMDADKPKPDVEQETPDDFGMKQLEKLGIKPDEKEEEQFRRLFNRVQEFESTLKAKELDRQRSEAELEELRNKMDATASVQMLEHDAVTFRGGYRYTIGEIIDYGKFEGKTVERIDYARRLVHLSGGLLLRMGVRVQDDVAGEARRGSGPVSRDLREPTPAAEASDVRTSPSGKAAFGLGRRDADSRVRPLPVE